MSQKESPFLVMVDIQPGFQDSCQEFIFDVVEKINKSEQIVICFYAGKTMDCDSQQDVMAYYMENGLDWNRLDGIRFIEKRWGWFRDWTDRGVPDEVTIDAVSHLLKSHKESTEEFTREDWDSVLKNHPAHKNVEFEDPLYAPDFNAKMFQNAKVDDFEIIGGGYHECLKEINIYLKALDKTTHINEDLCYGKKQKKQKKYK